MPRRKIEFINGEIYHIYNRGVDKRELFIDPKDTARFMQAILEFNTTKPIGSIRENTQRHKSGVPNAVFMPKGAAITPLVSFIAYCVNPNHYHFVLKQLVEGGISKFIQKFSQGYAMYFNEKHQRTGPLFSGCFKAKHVETSDYLFHLSAYVNLNFNIHKIGPDNPAYNFVRSSWKQYNEEMVGAPLIPCETNLILEHFKDKQSYKNYAEETVREIVKRRDIEKEETSNGLLE